MSNFSFPLSFENFVRESLVFTNITFIILKKKKNSKKYIQIVRALLVWVNFQIQSEASELMFWCSAKRVYDYYYYLFILMLLKVNLV